MRIKDLSLSLCVLFIGCSSPRPNQEMDIETIETAIDNAPQKVQVSFPETSGVRRILTASGKIVSNQVVKLAFREGGVLAMATQKNGQSVAKEAVIAEIDSRSIELEIRAAEVSLDKATHDFENLLADYQDTISLGENWSRIKQTMRMKSGLDESLVRYEQALLRLEYAQIYAPIDGWITDIKVDPGNYVNAGQEIATLRSLEYGVSVDILEYDAVELAIGQEVAVSPLSQEIVINGQITEINPVVGADGYLQVFVSIPTTAGLYPGMSTTVRMEIPESKAITVPTTAVVNKSGRQVVFSVEEGLAKWNYVTVGENNGEVIAILEGLDPTAKVIFTNNMRLAHDSPVEVVD